MEEKGSVCGGSVSEGRHSRGGDQNAAKRKFQRSLVPIERWRGAKKHGEQDMYICLRHEICKRKTGV